MIHLPREELIIGHWLCDQGFTSKTIPRTGLLTAKTLFPTPPPTPTDFIDSGSLVSVFKFVDAAKILELVDDAGAGFSVFETFPVACARLSSALRRFSSIRRFWSSVKELIMALLIL